MLKQLSVSLLAMGVICCIVDTWASSEMIDAHICDLFGGFTKSAGELTKANDLSQRLDEECEARQHMVEARENALQDLRHQRRSLIEVASNFRNAVLQHYPKYLALLRRGSPRKGDLETIAYNLVLTLRQRFEYEQIPGCSGSLIEDLQRQLADGAFIRSCQTAGTNSTIY